MPIFKPTMSMKRVTDITQEVLEKLEVKAILLDIDNTLTAQDKYELFEGVTCWLEMIKSSNIEVILVSNNYKRRVQKFAESVNLPFVHFSTKPFPFGFLRAKRLIKSKTSNILVVGDQVFTDILGANLALMKSILLEPQIEDKKISFARFKRLLERPIRKKYK